MRERRQKMHPVIAENAWVGGIQKRIVQGELQHLGITSFVQNWKRDKSCSLLGSFGHADQQPNAFLEAKNTRIKQALNLPVGPAWFQVGGMEKRILRKTPGQVICGGCHSIIPPDCSGQ